MNGTPRLPASLDWLGGPALDLATLGAGHVVVVLSWRVGCPDSRQALADVAHALAPFRGAGVVPIALHVPGQPREHDADVVRRAVGALPYVLAVDRTGAWPRAFAATSLPHLVVLDVDGTVVFQGSGVPVRRRLHAAVEALLHRASTNGRRTTLPWCPPLPPLPRLLPQGLAVVGERLWLAAPGHHRVYAIDDAGQVQASHGSGNRGLADGRAAQAEFATPVALLPLGEQVLVADAGAHTLRAIDRHSGDVATWSGTGLRGTDRQGGGYARDQALAGPCAMAPLDGGVLVAMELGRQIWQFDPATRAAFAWCGSGDRARRDGDEGAFVEPVALLASEHELWIADGDDGSVRVLDLAHQRLTTRWSGLQRPSALAQHAGRVYVAERWRPAVHVVADDGSLQPVLTAADGLHEPAGLVSHAGRLWVADAGADVLFALELGPDGCRAAAAVQRVAITGAPPLPNANGPHARALPPLHVRADSDVRLVVRAHDVAIDGEVAEIQVRDAGAASLAADRHVGVRVHAGRIELLVPVGAAGPAAWTVRVQGSRGAWQGVVAVTLDAHGPMTTELEPGDGTVAANGSD